MTYILELNEETRRQIEAEATKKQMAPEAVASQMLDEAAAAKRRAEVRAMGEKLFDDFAPVFEALAEGAK